MRVGIFIVLVALMGAFSSCKKEKIEIKESNDPVFTLSGDFNGESLSLIAGDDNVYMNTYTEIVNGVDLYSGSIGTINEFVSLGIYNGNVDFNQNFLQDILPTLVPQFALNSQLTNWIEASDYMNLAAIESISWSVNGVTQTSTDLNITKPGKYEVCAHVVYQGLTQKTLCNELILGYAAHANALVNFTTQAGILNAQLTPMMSSVSSVEWKLDGVSIGNTTNLTSNIGSGTKELSCTIHFSNGIVRTKRMLVNGTDSSKNVRDFSACEIYQSSPYFQDYKIVLKYTKNGVEYRSDFADNSQSTLNVLSFEYYGKNSNGKEVYKINVTGNVFLGKSGGSDIYPFSFSSNFGIEIP